MLKSNDKTKSKPSSFIVDERNKSPKNPQKSAPVSPKLPPKRKARKRTVRMPIFANKFGETLVKINSKNAHKALGELSKICKVKVRKSGADFLVVSVKSKHLSQIIAILNKLCYDNLIIGAVGVAPSFFRLLARWGIVVGIALSITAAILCSAFVTRVDVSGAESALVRKEVFDVLTSNGVKVGGNASSVDAKTLEKSLLEIGGVAFASVKKRGGRIYVFVKEELPSEEFEEIDGTSVVAKRRAVVTRVIVDGGTAVVKYGDVVNEGDILIDGYTEYGDERLSVRAAGEVWGKVYYQKKFYFANTKIVRTYGKTKTTTKLSFFGKTPKTPKCYFEEYELKVSVESVGFLIPYDVYRFEFREIKSVETSGVLGEDEMKKRAFSSLLEEIDSAVKLLEIYYQFEDAADGKYLTVTIEAEEKIS